MSTRIRSFRLGAIAATLIAIGADAPPQTIDAGGMTFQAPASWKSSKPSSTMRRAQLKVDPAEGDPEPAELVVFAFPGGAGTVEANVSRWQSQFKDKDGKPPKIESKTIKGKNVEVIRVETGGHFVAPEFPGSPKLLEQAGLPPAGGDRPDSVDGLLLQDDRPREDDGRRRGRFRPPDRLDHGRGGWREVSPLAGRGRRGNRPRAGA